MYYYDKEIDNISSVKSECYVCNHMNKYVQWEETVRIEDEDGDLISTEVECSFYHCKKCGYFYRIGDSENPDFYESINKSGISLMKNPIKATRQILTLRKHTDNLSMLGFLDYKEYEPKL